LFLFAAEQYDQQRFPFVPFRPDTQLRWIKGEDLLTGETVFAPAQLVLLFYKNAVGEARIGYPTSGGLAFHADRRKAILHGLYEFIERDAINVCWFCRLAPPRIDVDLKRQLMRQGNSRHLRISTPSIETVQIFLNTLDIRVPVFTAVGFDRSRGDHSFLGGGGAAANSDKALTQALFELGQTRVVLRSLGPSRIRSGSSLKDMTDFLDATVYYGFESNRTLLEWYTSSDVTVPWAALPSLTTIGKEDDYDATLRYARAAGLKPITFDFSDTCWPGATLVKVIVPQLTMACVPAYPYLGHPRYYEVPQKLGLADRRLSFRDTNVDPLPFP
jgi:ribosomal protein S12 methylthiotransferase accessory factor